MCATASTATLGLCVTTVIARVAGSVRAAHRWFRRPESRLARAGSRCEDHHVASVCGASPLFPLGQELRMDRIEAMQLYVLAGTTKTFSKAARSAGASQSTVSKQMSQLEKRL